MQFIDLDRQYRLYEKEIHEAINKVLSHGQFIMGPEIKELEEKLASFVHVKHCITAASGTATLEIALRALDIGPGDEVITTPFTWISPAEVIAQVGAAPVFVDIDPETFNLDPDLLESAITEKTKAIMPVSLYGQMADLTKINKIAAKYSLPVIEDAAQSFGSNYKGVMSGGATLIGSTSFFPAKTLGCYGDGGALFTSDDELAYKMGAIRLHGAATRHHHEFIGMNGRLDTLQAAILLAKLPHFPKEVEARHRLGKRYSELLKDVCQTPKILNGNTHVYSQYTIRVEERESVISNLKSKGIPTAVHYPKCVHLQPAFAYLGYNVGDFYEAEKASKEVLSLPMHPWLTDDEQVKICKALEEALSFEAAR